VVLFDDSLSECESHAGASRLRRQKELEYSRQHLRRNRRAPVRESATPSAVWKERGLERNVGRLRGGVYRVRQDALKSLGQLPAVDRDRRGRLRSRPSDRYCTALETTTLRLEHVIPNRIRVGGRQLEDNGPPQLE
jgi:hypothetical protein